MNDALIYDWNSQTPTPPPPVILLNDETLRDGLQSPSVRAPSIEEKLRILHLLNDVGIDSANIGLPGAGPHVVEHVDPHNLARLHQSSRQVDIVTARLRIARRVVME